MICAGSGRRGVCARSLPHRGDRLVSAGREESAHHFPHLVERLGAVQQGLMRVDAVGGG
jgi:hypothetical protein